MSKIDTVLFDLDGTILDTNELIITSFLESLKGIVPENFSREAIIPSMGEPLTDQLRKFSGYEDVTELVNAYREVNLRLHDEYVTLFEHVQEVMKRMHEQGIKIGVVTTKMRLTTERGLAFTGIAQYVDAIVTIDDVTHPKPHPEPVSRAIELLDTTPEATLMVGDSIVDMQSARAAGAVAVGVSWSLKGAQILRNAGANHIIDDMLDLYALVGME